MPRERAPASRGRVRALARQLWHEHDSPPRLAAAVAAGVIIGCSPFFGLHFAIGLGLAIVLRLNKLALLLGSQISIPPVAPLLGFVSVQLGAWVRRGHFVALAAHDFRLSRLPELLGNFLLDWLIGGFCVGLALALPIFGLTLFGVRRWRQRQTTPDERGAALRWRADVRRALGCYARTPRPHRVYARLKYALDPVYAQVCTLVERQDEVLDLGTGLGMLPVVLAVRAQGSRLTGVDWDARKVQSAQLAGADWPAITILAGDVRTHPIAAGSLDVVTLIDVLHYWPVEEQLAVLRRAAAGLRPGGRLILRETAQHSRSTLTRWIEAWAVRLGWNRGPGLCFRTTKQLCDELEQLGLRVETVDASSRLHRGNVLIWGRRPRG